MNTRKIIDVPGRPSTTRRTLLTGGAAGLAAVAGTTLGRVQSASAVTLPPSVVDWINATNNPNLTTLAKGDGTTDDTKAINGALNAASPGEVVYLPGPTAGSTVVGIYPVSAPLIVPNGVTLLGAVPVGADAGGSVDDSYGTVLKPAPNWSGGSYTNPGVIYINGSAATQYRTGVGNLWIDAPTDTNNKPPQGTAGIACYGSAFHGHIFNVGIRSMPGNGLWFTNNGPSRADGWIIDNVIIQSCNLNQASGVEPAGFYWWGEDTTISRVHVQAAPASTLSSQAGFYIAKGNNCRFIACRGDQNGDAGFVIDSNPGGTPNSPGSTIALIGCGTENNNNYGLKVINSSSGGTQTRTPVVCTGCSWDFDGRQGGASPTSGAGVFVQGVNAVQLIGCDITTGGNQGSVNHHYYPEYGLVTATPGVPQLVRATGGVWNSNSGPVNDTADMGPAGGLHVDVTAVTGSAWVNTSTLVPYNNGLATTPPAVTTPAVPSTGGTVTNNTGVDVAVYLTGGAVSLITVNGTAVLRETNATVYLTAGATIGLTYSSKPNWAWQAI